MTDRDSLIQSYLKKVKDHNELEAKVKTCN